MSARVVNRMRALLCVAVLAAGTESRDPYVLSAVFRVPSVEQMSGIDVLAEGRDTVRCVVVSDKADVLRELRVPVTTVAPDTERTLPSRVLRRIPGAVDLEGVAAESGGQVVWACTEQGSNTLSRLYRVPLDPRKPVRSFALDSILTVKNNGAESVAIVEVDGATELWVGRERIIPPLSIPPVYRYAVERGGNGIGLIGPFRLGVPIHRTQSGMDYDPLNDCVWILSRELHYVFAVRVSSATGSGVVNADSLSFGYTWDELLHGPSLPGMAEGVACDSLGNMFVVFDNNRIAVGLDSTATSTDSRLLVLRRQ